MKLSLLTSFLLLYNLCLGQPELEWQGHYDSSAWHQYSSVVQCSDGGFAFVAATEIPEKHWKKDKVLEHRKSDILLVRTDRTGEEIWRKYIGGYHHDSARKILQTADGGFIIGGNTRSTNGDVSFKWGTTRHHDAWVIKTDENGHIEWERVIGGTESEHLWDLDICLDGSFVIVGYTWSVDGVFTPEHRADCHGVHPHIFATKLNPDGIIEWINLMPHGCYQATRIIATQDGGYSIGGVSSAYSDQQAAIFKLNASGKTQWTSTYGGSDWYDHIYELEELPGGGFIFAANTCSTNGDISNRTASVRNSDVWLVRTDASGELIWEEHWGADVSGEFVKGLQIAPDGGFLLAVEGPTAGDQKIDYHGANHNTDVKVVKYSSTGEYLWLENLRAYGRDEPKDLQVTADGGFVLIGAVEGREGSFAYQHLRDAEGSMWMAKFGPEGNETHLVQAYIHTHQTIDISGVLNNVGEVLRQSAEDELSMNGNSEMLKSTDATVDYVEVIAFPNPASSVLNLDIRGIDVKSVEYVLLGPSGKIIEQGKRSHFSNWTFDVLSLPHGIYFLRLHINGQNKARVIPFVRR